MSGALRLEGALRSYPWGSRTALAAFLGRPSPAAEPQAELWLGAHPRASARLEAEDGWVSLGRAIERDPEGLLGAEVVERFGEVLPFMLKVIAVARPLSLQAHPDAAQARAGFARENALGLALDAPQRCYPDPRGKPELVCALEEFSALVGLRADAAIRADLARLGIAPPERASRGPCSKRVWLEAWLREGSTWGVDAVEAALARARRGSQEDPTLACLLGLADQHPGDPAALAPLFMNRVRLEPGEALFLPPGVLHVYLEGLGVELMANSDNVVRAGLTSKHVDLQELLRIASSESGGGEPLVAAFREPGISSYRTSASEFELSVLEVAGGGSITPARAGSAEVLLCARGRARIWSESAGPACSVARGDSLLVPASSGRYRLAGNASVYRASLPSG